ncbi:MAG: CaiB/BaiF CoA-transferase family protein [Henriciella sp.]
MSGPLEGYRVIELAGIGPGPYAGQLLADLGAEVISVQRLKGLAVPMIEGRGKKSIAMDLKKPGAAEIILKLVASADALIEGNRPGVTERLGVGPEACHEVNPKLVYGRMTGWGQTGPWSGMAGHDINYISITGALHAMGRDGEPPMPPLNLVGDYGGGSMVLVAGILSALLKAEKTGKGDIVDAAILDGSSSLMGLFYTLSGLGQWTPKRESNMLDGAFPYYRCYTTSDDKYMAVGCLEPQFFSLMLDTLGIDAATFGGQNDRSCHPAQTQELATIFATKTRDEWAAIFDGVDACVTPVLDYQEAASHPQNQARGGLKTIGPFTHPRTVPAFASRPEEPAFDIPLKGADTESVLLEAGFSKDALEELTANAVISIQIHPKGPMSDPKQRV